MDFFAKIPQYTIPKDPEFYFTLDEMIPSLADIVKKIRTSMREPEDEDSHIFSLQLNQFLEHVLAYLGMKLVPLGEHQRRDSAESYISMITADTTIMRENIE